MSKINRLLRVFNNIRVCAISDYVQYRVDYPVSGLAVHDRELLVINDEGGK